VKTTIGVKLGFGFGAVIVLLVISAATAYYNISWMQVRLAQVLDEAVPIVRSCDRLLSSLNEASAGLRGYVSVEPGSANSNNFRMENQAAWQVVWEQLSLIAKYSALQNDDAQGQQVASLTQMARDLHGSHKQVFGLSTTPNTAGGGNANNVAIEQVWLNQCVPKAREIKVAAEQLTSAAEAREKLAREQLDAASQTTVVALGTAALIGIVIGCGVAAMLSRRIAVTVRSLADRARQISEGDLRGQPVPLRGADELGQLADGFNVMLANLRDLTGQIRSVSENVNSATSQISSSAKQQAASTKEQAATVQEITTTMQEISQSGGQIVARAKEVAAVAEQASSASKSGIDAVQNTNRTMEAIRDSVEEVAENIVALSEKTQAVGEVISTVNEIAEQSNLLALNASIEAAEAGDEGNRFSVVAGEMKNLADQAKECTVHVRKILGEIQKAINTSVMLTEEAVKRVESGKQQADVSENVIRQITSTTEESIQAFQQIIAATNQQQVGLEQVARGMQDIDQAAQQTATGTGQLEQAAVNLSAMSKQLRTAVASYKV
jgi:methyl-accepting chemotaxis protein